MAPDTRHMLYLYSEPAAATIGTDYYQDPVTLATWAIPFDTITPDWAGEPHQCVIPGITGIAPSPTRRATR